MNQPSMTPLLTVSNHHVSGEEPPMIDGDEPTTYHSEFENRYGEQSHFDCRHDTKVAKVYSGDAGWKAFAVVDGQVPGLILAPDEAVWLSACLMAIGADHTATSSILHSSEVLADLQPLNSQTSTPRK